MTRKTKVSSYILGLVVGWLLASIVFAPPLMVYEGWVTLVLIAIAWILSIMDM